MAEEGYDRTARIGERVGEDQGVTDETGDTRPQRVMATRVGRGLPGALRDGVVWHRRYHPRGDGLVVGRAPHGLAGHRRKMGPQRQRSTRGRCAATRTRLLVCTTKRTRVSHAHGVLRTSLIAVAHAQ